MDGVDFLLLTALDEIAWLLNLRGADIDYNPVFFSYLIFNVAEKSSTLFIEASKVKWITQYLDEHKVTVAPYENIEEALSQLASEGKKVAADLTKCNARLHPIIKDNFEDKQKCVDLLKAMKNKTEQEGMRNANVRDCAGIMRYFAFLEEELWKKDHGLTEWSGALVLEDL